MTASALLFLSLFLSLMMVTRILNGVVIVHRGESPKDLASLPLTAFLTAAAWALFYFVTH